MSGQTMDANNHTTQCHTNAPGFLVGHWYLNQEGELFIVPNAVAGIAGSDKSIIARLDQAYCLMDFDAVDPKTIAKQLDLEFVPASYRHFCEDVGFYCC